MSEFFVGQKVVCVDDQCYESNGVKKLFVGQTYTVRALGPYDHSRVGHVPECLWLAGIARPWRGRDVPYKSARFQPLESKAISLFRKIARDVTDGRKAEFVE